MLGVLGVPGAITLIVPTSMRSSRPVRATVNASSTDSIGSSRLRANRLPVPPGSRPIGTSESTSAAATARTVPSPPSGQIRSAPSSIACRAWPAPGSSGVVSIHAGGSQPCSRQTASMLSRVFAAAASSSNFVGLTMIAARDPRRSSGA